MLYMQLLGRGNVPSKNVWCRLPRCTLERLNKFMFYLSSEWRSLSLLTLDINILINFHQFHTLLKVPSLGFPSGSVAKNPPANGGDMGSITGPGRSHSHRATKPVGHNSQAHALEPRNLNYWAHVLQLLKSTHLESMLRNKRSHFNEKPTHCN